MVDRTGQILKKLKAVIIPLSIMQNEKNELHFHCSVIMDVTVTLFTDEGWGSSVTI